VVETLLGAMTRMKSAAGAMVASFSQAFGSFLLQVLALRFLGFEGLGNFAMAFGIIVIATAIVTGLIGDSLTVLDRSDPHIRAGLQWWLLIVAGGCSVVMGAGAEIANFLTSGRAVIFGLAVAMFVVEDVMRRMLMASIRFWSIVIVDTSAFVISVAIVLVVHATGHISLATFLVALAVGQAFAIGVGVACLPRSERWLARGVSPQLAPVWRYGSWRAAQQLVRPSMLAIIRVVVALAASIALYGQIEAARVYIAPAMLAVGGVASYLFASNARDRDASLETLRARADWAVIRLGIGVSFLGLAGVLLLPVLGPLLVPGKGSLDRIAVAGWSAYAAATAMVTPYGALAAVRGKQAAVLGLRVAESVASIAGIGILLAAGGSEFLVPAVLAVFALVSGLAIRMLLLTPKAHVVEPAKTIVGASRL
jgi:O-antigen/teichoic acid export membrane protein